MYTNHSFNSSLISNLSFPTPINVKSAQLGPITKLTVEYMDNPIGIDTKHPRFSWKMVSNIQGAKQSAYELIIADNERNLKQGKYIWRSGKISSSQSVNVTYTGDKELKPSTRYYWKVKVWNQDNKVLESKEKAYFETGLMSTDGKTNWEGAQWITSNHASTDSANVTLFRTERKLSNKPIERAQLYITSLGIYDAFINGKEVKLLKEDKKTVDETFNPGWTDYHSYVNYQAYDVTHYLSNKGSVTLGAMVGKGWFGGRIGEIGQYNKITENKLALLAKMVITYKDGSKDIIVTNDSTWKSSEKSPILTNDFYDGETYDANIEEEIKGWNNGKYDDSQWSNVSSLTYDGKVKGSRAAAARIAEEYTQYPIKAFKYRRIEQSSQNGGKSTYDFGHAVTTTLNPKSHISLKAGETLIMDMGQNMAGVPNIKLNGIKGSTVTIRYAEMLNDGRKNPTLTTGGSDGPKDTLYRKALTTAAQTDKYILSGKGVEEYQPRFTFHGYRYMEITADKDININSIEGKVITSVKDQTGTIKTSNEDVNKLFNNVLWGQRSNYLSIPTDSPQRAERVGWTGDVQLFAQTALYNYNDFSFLENYSEIMDTYNRNNNGAYGSIMPNAFVSSFAKSVASGWGDSGIIIPWVLYQQTGDTTIIEKNFAQMDKYMDYVGENGYDTELFGDWLAFQPTSTVFLNTVYRAYDAQLMANMAKAIGHEDAVEKYEKLYTKTKTDFINKYFDEEGNLLTASADNFTESRHGYPGADNAQTGLLWALKLGLYETEQQKEKMISNLTKNIENKNGTIRPDQPENTLAVGFLGVNVILPTLSDVGHHDVAYTLLLQDEMPSWLYSVKNGATTIWERWNSYSLEDSFGDSSMNSFNHYSYGAIAEWMYKYMAGISHDPKNPGFQHFVLQPTIDSEHRISWLDSSYDSVYGRIKSKWKVQNRTFKYQATIPANTTATVILPAKSLKEVKEGKVPLTKAKGIKVIEFKDGKVICEVISGTYNFESKLN
ncbi:family 78 glycoside hydrolase catalytic domain [Priestia filamentosa]|uniref:family 78 glycoside hydrolase catalytic domain n=1 Tax=Priestia filamentosa TaxID=1402861 RepID=UPI0038576119